MIIFGDWLCSTYIYACSVPTLIFLILDIIGLANLTFLVIGFDRVNLSIFSIFVINRVKMSRWFPFSYNWPVQNNPIGDNSMNNRKYVEAILSKGACKDCGSTSNLVFHHRNKHDRLFDISSGYFRPFAQLAREIGKCDIVCSACHAKYHGSRNREMSASELQAACHAYLLGVGAYM